VTMTTNINPIEKTSSGFLAASGRYTLLLMLLVFAGFVAWLQFSVWQPSGSRLLVPEDTLPANIETMLKVMLQAERDGLILREQAKLKSHPLDIQALKNLIMLYNVAGDTQKSENMITVAAKRSLRDLPLQTAALKIQLGKQEYADVLYRIDALIRSKPSYQKEFFVAMMGFAEIPAARVELVKKLAEDPPWRAQFMSTFNSETKQPDLVYGLYSTLRKSGKAVTSLELRQLLQRLVNDQSYEKASFIWLDFLSEVELRKARLLFDGGFDLDFGNRFFDWSVTKVQNADLRIMPRATGSADRVLRLEFANGRTAYNHFSQILRLAPGDYVFSGEQKAEQLESTSAMVWQISCLNKEGAILAVTPGLKDTIAWGAFATPFAVPLVECATQRLSLKLNAVAVLDQQVSGRVFYDGLSIVHQE
jgi:hypothetical protein